MKTILVIELDDEWLDRINTTYDEMLADVTIYKKESLKNQCDYSQRLYRCWCPLKPMPQKKNKNLLNKNTTIKDFNSYCSYRDGWNDCLKEILGEKE